MTHHTNKFLRIPLYLNMDRQKFTRPMLLMKMMLRRFISKGERTIIFHFGKLERTAYPGQQSGLIMYSRFYSAMFSKPSTKKHKTWDEDGFIVTDGTNVILKVF